MGARWIEAHISLSPGRAVHKLHRPSPQPGFPGLWSLCVSPPASYRDHALQQTVDDYFCFCLTVSKRTVSQGLWADPDSHIRGLVGLSRLIERLGDGDFT